MKPFIEFENVSQSEREKKQIAEFWDKHDKSSPLETFKAIFFPTMSLILVITGIVIILRTIDPPHNFAEIGWRNFVYLINDIPTWINWCIVLFLLCVISVSWTIVRSAKRG